MKFRAHYSVFPGPAKENFVEGVSEDCVLVAKTTKTQKDRGRSRRLENISAGFFNLEINEPQLPKRGAAEL